MYVCMYVCAPRKVESRKPIIEPMAGAIGQSSSSFLVLITLWRAFPRCVSVIRNPRDFCDSHNSTT